MRNYISHSELSATDNSSILFPMIRSMNELNKIQGMNLRRLRNKMSWSQGTLAEKAGIEQSKISAYENGLGFNKETLVTFCNVFNVRSWEFSWEESTPIIKDEQEADDIKQRREAEKVGIADMVREAEASWIVAAKKKDGSGGKGKAGRVPRSSPKRG